MEDSKLRLREAFIIQYYKIMQQLIVIILHSSVMFAGVFLYHTTVLFYFQLFLRFIVVFMSFHFICNGHLSALCSVALLCYVRWTSQLFVMALLFFIPHTLFYPRCSLHCFCGLLLCLCLLLSFCTFKSLSAMAIIRPVRWALYIDVSMLDERYLSCCQAAPSSADVFKVTFGNNAEFVSVG